MAFNKLGAFRAVSGLLVSTTISATGDTVLFTCALGNSVEISQATVANTSGSAATFGLSIGKPGSTARKVVPPGFSIDAGDAIPLRDYLEGHLLNEGDFIQITAGTANVLDVVISGTIWSM